MKRTLLILIAVALVVSLGLEAAWLFGPLRSQAGPPLRVLRWTRDLPAGQEVSAADVEAVEVPASAASVLKGALRDTAEDWALVVHSPVKCRVIAGDCVRYLDLLGDDDSLVSLQFSRRDLAAAPGTLTLSERIFQDQPWQPVWQEADDVFIPEGASRKYGLRMDGARRGAGAAEAYGFLVGMDIPAAEAYYRRKLTALGYVVDTRTENEARKDYVALAFVRGPAKYIVSLLTADNIKDTKVALLIFRPDKQQTATDGAGAKPAGLPASRADEATGSKR